MQLTAEQIIALPRGQVWEALNDVEVLRACVPGCRSLDRDDDGTLRIVSEIRIGPVTARFNGSLAILDAVPDASCTLEGRGRGGTLGDAAGSARVCLRDCPEGTALSYVAEAQVTGRLAQLGGPLIDATARRLAGDFFVRFSEVASMSGEGPAAPAAVVTTGPAHAGAAAATTSGKAGESLPERAPWRWLVALAIGILAGFLLGRSSAQDQWLLALVLAVVAAAWAGFAAGRRGGGGV